MSGSEKWRTSHWSEMLHDILPILEAHKPGTEWWSFGGGTALACHLDHRTSYDIDLFVDSSNTLRALTPNANCAVRALVGSHRHDFPGHYLKLPVGADPIPWGEIDIIVAAPVTDNPTQSWMFEGKPLQLETPDEIIAKKLFFRPSTFKVRDIFDLAAVLDRDPNVLRRIARFVEDRLDKAIDRVQLLAPGYEEAARQDVNPTPTGKKYLAANIAITLVLPALQTARQTSVNLIDDTHTTHRRK